MKHSFKSVAIAAAIAVPCALIAQTASAALVTSWGYDIESGFSAFAPTTGENHPTGSVPNTSTGAAAGLPTVVSWGPSGNQSSISISGSVTNPPPVITNGGTVPGATFGHDNHVIPNSTASLTTATILSELTLTPLAPPSETGGSLPPFTQNFNINFEETPNVAGSCPTGSTTTCDDIFILRNPSELTQAFSFDGSNYLAKLNIDGLTTFTGADADVCTRVGLSSGCQGVLTGENQPNSIPTTFSISSVAVPEPGTLSIMGLGLIGLAFLGIRRNRSEG